MKAILQENEVEFEKIHDLNVLLEQCKSFIPELEAYKDELTDLSAYAVDIRYPGIDISMEEADTCVKIMEKLRKEIRNYFRI
ncbi:MAG: HEPN domain-containing protein [Candidatus Omnitrophica bacterium]|nr:HEPN domain-containing protein [Candidatus Omnitrophota bacterium]